METEKQVTTQTTAEITVVKQEELIRYIQLDNNIKAMEAEKDALAEELKRLLMAGANVEPGTHRAEAKLSESRRPSWKDEFLKLGDKLKGVGEGQKLADKVLERTEPTSSVKLTIR